MLKIKENSTNEATKQVFFFVYLKNTYHIEIFWIFFPKIFFKLFCLKLQLVYFCFSCISFFAKKKIVEQILNYMNRKLIILAIMYFLIFQSLLKNNQPTSMTKDFLVEFQFSLSMKLNKSLKHLKLNDDMLFDVIVALKGLLQWHFPFFKLHLYMGCFQLQRLFTNFQVNIEH